MTNFATVFTGALSFSGVVRGLTKACIEQLGYC